MPHIDISHLSHKERLDLIGQLCDSLDAEGVPLTAAQEAEIERRLETLDEDIKQGTSWEDIEAELDRRYQ